MSPCRLYCSFISTTSDAARLQARLHAAEETAARAVVWFVARAAVEAGSWALAVAALAHRYCPEWHEHKLGMVTVTQCGLLGNGADVHGALCISK